jgi:hypothetical protein
MRKEISKFDCSIKTAREFIFSAVLICLCITGYSKDVTLPQGVIEQLPKGYSVMTFQSGDINSDKLTDYIVVVHKENEAAISRHAGTAPRRPLLVFFQTSDKTFFLAGRNDLVVFAVDEGGQCDPFLDSGNGITIKGTYFTIENEVACGAHWTDYITFKYSEVQRNLIFHKRIRENWTLNMSQDPKADALVLESRKVTAGRKDAPILLKDYKPN